jgi:hypothetical protein
MKSNEGGAAYWETIKTIGQIVMNTRKIEHTNDGGVEGCKGGYMENTCQDAHHVVESWILQCYIVGQPPQAIYHGSQ